VWVVLPDTVLRPTYPLAGTRLSVVDCVASKNKNVVYVYNMCVMLSPKY
jgi:hypothetical protein